MASLVPIASKGSKETHVSFRGDSIPIRLFEADSFRGADMVISACSPSVGREPYAALVEEGIPLIDLSGVYGTDLPILAAGIQGGQGNRLREAGVVTAARPNHCGGASVRVQTRLAVLRVSGTLMMPAAIAGREGVEASLAKSFPCSTAKKRLAVAFQKGSHLMSFRAGAATERGWAGCDCSTAFKWPC